MKRLMMTLFTMVVMAGGLATAEVAPQRTQWVGVNPLGLVFNIYSCHYGRYLKDGAADITIPFFYWHPLDELTILGGGAKYHIYPDADGTGVFYGGGAQVGYVSWDYEWLDWDSGTWRPKMLQESVLLPMVRLDTDGYLARRRNLL
jgi:hypothetical protein